MFYCNVTTFTLLVFICRLFFVLVLKRANSDNFHKGQKLSLPPKLSQNDFDDGVNDTSIAQLHTSLTTSTPCLPDSFDYSTSAKLTEHFPQKTLTPSSFKSSQPREGKNNRKLTTDGRAPVATVDEPGSPELDQTDSVLDNSLAGSDNTGSIANSSVSSETETVRAKSSPGGDNSEVN